MDAEGCKPHIDYPCRWTYKVIGRSREDLRGAVAEVIGQREHTVAFSRSSAGGAYHCLNVTLTVEYEADRLDLYHRLCGHPSIQIVM
ncbi:MAG: HP0495 family protein [Syntrophales bacterium]